LPLMEESFLICERQFGLRQKHTTIEQIYRLIEKINKTFEEKKFCSSVFMDVS